jgi:hypothetical protein
MLLKNVQQGEGHQQSCSDPNEWTMQCLLDGYFGVVCFNISKALALLFEGELAI